MDALLGDFIPFGVIFLGNVAIVTRIIGARNKRADQMRVVAKYDGKVGSIYVKLHHLLIYKY